MVGSEENHGKTMIDAPVSLCGIFNDSDDDSVSSFDQCYETEDVNVCGAILKIRQYAFHSHNANRVWPGTFNLAEYLLRTYENKKIENASDRAIQEGEEVNEDDCNKDSSKLGKVLELGAATGILSLRLLTAGSEISSSVTTTDVEDDGEVEKNIEYNYALNGFTDKKKHIPHTWGSGFVSSARKHGFLETELDFDTIVASDILLYVSAYPALVETIKELFELKKKKTNCDINEHISTKPVFIMSWNRRMKESQEFFDMMEAEGFKCKHEGKCIFTFTKNSL